MPISGAVSIKYVERPPFPGASQYRITIVGGGDKYAASVWKGNAPRPYRDDRVLGFALSAG